MEMRLGFPAYVLMGGLCLFPLQARADTVDISSATLPGMRGVPVAIPAPPSYTGAALAPEKLNFNLGLGPTAVSGSHDLLKGGEGMVVGGGYNFNPHTALDLEFANSWLDVTNAAVQQNQATHGSARIWSVTLDPVWRYQIHGIVGGYLIGGGGFYERDVHYTTTQNAVLPLAGGGSVLVPVRTATVDQTDDAGGVNVGIGFTFNVASGAKFYVEARYHYILTPGYATQIIPITFGFRF